MAMLTACGGPGERKIQIYVTPYYNCEPFSINVGEYSEQLKSGSVRKMLALADEIKSKVDEVNIQTLYVLAIRLYDLGEKEDAMYWFYTAQLRRNVFIAMYDKSENAESLGAPAFEIKHALLSFHQLAGQWINGYAGGEIDTWIATLEKVVDESKQMGYIAKAYPNISFKPESEQKQYIDEQVASIRELAKMLDERREEYARTRKENGMEGKY